MKQTTPRVLVPARTPSGDADAAGGWHPSLTVTFGDSGTPALKKPK